MQISCQHLDNDKGDTYEGSQSLIPAFSELLIVGPIPPFLRYYLPITIRITITIMIIPLLLLTTRKSHLAANPGAVVGEDAYTEYAKVGASL